MRVLVALKRVPDPAQRIHVDAAGRAMDPAGVRWILNPYDEVALEEAIRWKESGAVTEVIAVTAGPSADVLRTALAFGAGRAILAKCDEGLPPLAVAQALRAVVEREKPDAVLLGTQSSDRNSAQVGPMLAGLLGWPQVTRAVRAELRGGVMRADRVGDQGVETLEADLPCVVTAELRLNKPRMPGVLAVLKAKQQPIDERAVAATHTPALEVVRMTEVASARAATRVADAHELVAALRARGAIA